MLAMFSSGQEGFAKEHREAGRDEFMFFIQFTLDILALRMFWETTQQ